MQNHKQSKTLSPSLFKKEIHRVDFRIDALTEKLEESTNRLDKKIDERTQRLDEKIDASTKRLDEKIDASTKKLDEKIDALADRLVHAIQQTNVRVDRIEETMATKNDIREVIDHIDAFAKRIDVYDKKAIVHDYRFNQLEPKVDDHEKRLSRLESAP